ncbi:hypothetical protein KUTeg_008975 [Tegillarca granosa]|uniref:Uncharacterized protein n=1 Tax=Tegillarca granosa TaxID=220873 RepID=A0ABQ9FAT3_TEGGR|nr:hypothetical protein KUTeg_008975 [Tegillarca granosa]
MDKGNMAAAPMDTGMDKTQDRLYDLTSKIQDTVNTILSKLNSQGERVDKISNDIYQAGGIKENLQTVIEGAVDRDTHILELNTRNKMLENKVELLSSYVVRLEQKIDNMQTNISDLTDRSTRENVIITNFPEKKGEDLRVDSLGIKMSKLIGYIESVNLSTIPDPGQ